MKNVNCFSFEELKAICKSGSRSEMHNAFGTHFKQLNNLMSIYSFARNRYDIIQNWAENCKTLVNGLKPEIEQEKFGSVVSSINELNQEQREKILAMLQSKN